MAENIPTKRLNLDRVYTFYGKHYGPGAVDVPTKLTVPSGDRQGTSDLNPAEEIQAAQQRHYEADVKAGRLTSLPVHRDEMEYKRAPISTEDEHPANTPASVTAKPVVQQPARPANTPANK